MKEKLIENTDVKMENVFVYGTLRKGHGNHALMLNSDFIGRAVTKEQYLMGVRGVPIVVKPTGSAELDFTNNIKGEVYAVDEDTMERLDLLEGHPSWYKRELVEVETQGGQMKAWLYFMPAVELAHNENYRIITSGDYNDSFK